MATSVPYRCDSPKCREDARLAQAADVSIFYIAPNADKVCPNCGTRRPNHLTELVTIHLLVPVSPSEKGDRVGPDFDHNYGCDTAKKNAVARKQQQLTADPAACTCQDCLANLKAAEAEEDE